ncbi:helix-turn-helix domain-containing protein [Thermomonospora umbrina]|uniref:HTH cro/C1-type domain-containing protein n=1 Tax=Thermomonospora umbrina TaxID=111806 RepID=A0A3D9SP83_9ACTN|nr:helix-turn-helix transcriptional regulator [Thermomonospora umbrina]REE97772.1 hypothetical protein DFJ69_3247 [Thermomonospora umbrina]
MSVAESLDPLGGLWSLLAVHLRILRKQNGMSQVAVGTLVAADHKTVSNWEAGRYHPPVEALRILDVEWKTGGLLEAIHHYAKTMQAPAKFRAISEYEEMADVIRVNGVGFIPGLLQTAEYAREAFTTAGILEVEKQVERRLQRQDLFTRPTPPYVSVLLSEVAVLLIPPSLRRAQLGKLLEISDRHHVTLRMVAVNAGLHLGLEGDFYIYSTPLRELGFVETPARGRLVTEADDLRRLTVAFDRTSGRALSPEATRAKLQEMIEVSNDDMA